MNIFYRDSSLRNPLRKIKAFNPGGNIIKLTKEEYKLKDKKSLINETTYLN